jgi:hypothetical protein
MVNKEYIAFLRNAFEKKVNEFIRRKFTKIKITYKRNEKFVYAKTVKKK